MTYQKSYIVSKTKDGILLVGRANGSDLLISLEIVSCFFNQFQRAMRGMERFFYARPGLRKEEDRKIFLNRRRELNCTILDTMGFGQMVIKDVDVLNLVQDAEEAFYVSSHECRTPFQVERSLGFDTPSENPRTSPIWENLRPNEGVVEVRIPVEPPLAEVPGMKACMIELVRDEFVCQYCGEEHIDLNNGQSCDVCGKKRS